MKHDKTENTENWNFQSTDLFVSEQSFEVVLSLEGKRHS